MRTLDDGAWAAAALRCAEADGAAEAIAVVLDEAVPLELCGAHSKSASRASGFRAHCGATDAADELLT